MIVDLIIVCVNELLRPKAEREDLKKREGDRIQYMHEDLAIHEMQSRNAIEQRRRRDGLTHRQPTKPVVNRSRKSTLRGGFPW